MKYYYSEWNKGWFDSYSNEIEDEDTIKKLNNAKKNKKSTDILIVEPDTFDDHYCATPSFWFYDKEDVKLVLKNGNLFLKSLAKRGDSDYVTRYSIINKNEIVNKEILVEIEPDPMCVKEYVNGGWCAHNSHYQKEQRINNLSSEDYCAYLIDGGFSIDK